MPRAKRKDEEEVEETPESELPPLPPLPLPESFKQKYGQVPVQPMVQQQKRWSFVRVPTGYKIKVVDNIEGIEYTLDEFEEYLNSPG